MLGRESCNCLCGLLTEPVCRLTAYAHIDRPDVSFLGMLTQMFGAQTSRDCLVHSQSVHRVPLACLLHVRYSHHQVVNAFEPDCQTSS